MARRVGRAWGNALGGYKFQKRTKGGKFGSGFVGNVPTSQLTTKAERRAAYLKKEKRKSNAKKAAVIAGGVAVAAGAGFATYKNRDAVSMAISPVIKKQPKTMTVSYNVGSETQAARDWMYKNSIKRARAGNANTNSASSVSKAMKIAGGTGVAATAARNVAESAKALRDTQSAFSRRPEGQVANSGGVPRPQSVPGAGMNQPFAAPIPEERRMSVEPGAALAGGPANAANGSAGQRAAQLHREKVGNARRKTAGGYKNLRGEMKGDNSTFAGGDFAESEQFDNMFDGPQRYVKPEAMGRSKNVKSGTRTHRNPAGRQALTGAARQGVRNRKMHEIKYIEGISDPRYRGGVSDATISSVLPSGLKVTDQPLYTDGKSPELRRKQGRLFQEAQGLAKGSELKKTQDWFLDKRRQEFEKLEAKVPQVNSKYGSTLAITKNYDFVDKKGKRVKGTKIEGQKFDHPTFKKISQPWEDILAKEGLAPMSLGSYRSTNEIAGSLHGATNTIFHGGAFEDESWKFKNRRA
ncbi:hypothetical protein SEA_LITTLEFELLA_5 [Gordonia phage LittleFella]|nr:hypothetical protein SEA_LITTLEFELLA_5 [Gordonia phage LittleFella]